MTKIIGCTPYFEVFDMNESIEFYCGKLGFHIIFASRKVNTKEGKFSHFVQLGLGNVRLMLNTAYDSNERPTDRTEPRWAGCQHVALYLDCEDVSKYFADVSERGIVAKGPEETRYGYWAMSLQDPDGYRIIFHQPLAVLD